MKCRTKQTFYSHFYSDFSIKSDGKEEDLWVQRKLTEEEETEGGRVRWRELDEEKKAEAGKVEKKELWPRTRRRARRSRKQTFMSP